MDENKNFEEQVNDVVNQIGSSLKKGADALSSFVNQQAEILKMKSDISQAKKDLASAYEQFGRGMYAETILKTTFENKEFVMDQIQSKEKILSLLQEKLNIKEGH